MGAEGEEGRGRVGCRPSNKITIAPPPTFPPFQMYELEMAASARKAEVEEEEVSSPRRGGEDKVSSMRQSAGETSPTAEVSPRRVGGL